MGITLTGHLPASTRLVKPVSAVKKSDPDSLHWIRSFRCWGLTPQQTKESTARGQRETRLTEMPEGVSLAAYSQVIGRRKSWGIIGTQKPDYGPQIAIFQLWSNCLSQHGGWWRVMVPTRTNRCGNLLIPGRELWDPFLDLVGEVVTFATALWGLQYVTAPVEERNPVGLDLWPSHDCAQKSDKVRGACGASRFGDMFNDRALVGRPQTRLSRRMNGIRYRGRIS